MGSEYEDKKASYGCPAMNAPITLPASGLVAISVFDFDKGADGLYDEENGRRGSLARTGARAPSPSVAAFRTASPTVAFRAIATARVCASGCVGAGGARSHRCLDMETERLRSHLRR